MARLAAGFFISDEAFSAVTKIYILYQ